MFATSSSPIVNLSKLLKTIDLSCSNDDLEKLGRLARSHSADAVRQLGITPLIVGSLKPEVATAFNGDAPFSYVRGENYKKLSSWNEHVKPVVDDISLIFDQVCSQRPFTRLDLDFTPVEPNATQRIDFLHIDAASPESDYALHNSGRIGDLFFVIINGDDGDLNTWVFPDRIEDVLTVYNAVFETDFDNGAMIFNEKFLQQVSSITTPTHLPPNSVAFALQEYTIHGSAFNRGPGRRKRSFARLSY